VDELITGVNIALGDEFLGRCFRLDLNRDATISVDEILKAVNEALHACAA
jgi:hypothetical protein